MNRTPFATVALVAVSLPIGCFSTSVKAPKSEEDPFAGTTLGSSRQPINEAPPPKNSQAPDMDYIKDMLHRSANQAVKCDYEEVKGPRDVAVVEVTFTNNGRVDKVEVRAPHEGTPMGSCIFRAFEGIFVTAWEGSETVTLERQIDFSKKEQDPTP